MLKLIPTDFASHKAHLSASCSRIGDRFDGSTLRDAIHHTLDAVESLAALPGRAVLISGLLRTIAEAAVFANDRDGVAVIRSEWSALLQSYAGMHPAKKEEVARG